METVLISGGTGLIGKALTSNLLDKGFQVIILTRGGTKSRPAHPGIRYASWDINEGKIDADAISSADHIIHLAGANVAEKRWTKKRKKEIVDSRVKSGKLLVKSLKEIPNKVKTVVAASAIGWYGADPSIPNPNPFVETNPADKDFLGEVCEQWESAITPVKSLNKKLVILRTGIVLSSDGGAYVEFAKPLKFGLATILGSGKQVISWIHIADIVRLYVEAITTNKLDGVYNAVAPLPVSNKELILEIAKLKKGKFYIPIHVPSFALKIALGEMSVEVLKSATVSAGKLKEAGFTFLYPTLEAAVKAV